MFRNYIFDWSGTLVDDLGPVLEATNAVLGSCGKKPVTRDNFRREFQLPFQLYYDEKVPGADMVQLEMTFRTALSASSEPVTIIPHALEFLKSCTAAEARLFVLSSAPQEAVERQAEDLGLHLFFECIYAGVRDKRTVISGILTDRGLSAQETVMIGDMRHDVHAAKAGGIHSVAVLTGYEFPEVIATAHPDVMVDHLGILRGQYFSAT